MARSGLPSPLKSAVASEKAPVGTPNLTAGWKEPSPLPSKTETAPLVVSATAKSGKVSLLRFPSVRGKIVALESLRGAIWASASGCYACRLVVA